MSAGVPFITATTYEVWFQLPGQDWRQWSARYVEHQHALDEKTRVEDGAFRGKIAPRLRWMPLRIVVLSPLAMVAWVGSLADKAFWAIEERIR